MRYRRGRSAPSARVAGALAGCLLAAGCATWSDSFHEIERWLAQEQYAEALRALERQSDARREPLLYQLNKAMLLRMAGDYAASNEAFEAAKALIDEYSAVSLREQAARFIINDAADAYAGEEHEQVLVHLYGALNYIALGELDSARVEALQVDLRLRRQAERARDAAHVENPFARYLTGMIYEDLAEWSDALIAYRKSYEAYRVDRERDGVGVPHALQHDLLRLTEHLGLTDELRRYQEEFGIERWTGHSAWREQGEVVFLLHNGLAPVKREQSTTLLDPASGHLVRISLPYYQARAPLARGARVNAAAQAADTEVYENVSAAAIRALEAKMPAITARAVARAVVKVQLARAARDNARRQHGDHALAAIIGLGVEIGNVLTERADTRSWATLPHDIQVARLALAPGRYSVEVQLLGAGGGIVRGFELQDVVVRPGRKTYISRHWIASRPPTPRRIP